MRKRRAEHFQADVLTELLKANTYGGGKHEKRQRHEMPKVADQEGVKIEYGPGEKEYPVFVSLQMTDGAWVKYQIYREQPAISPALADVANMRRGYPPERS